MTKQKAKLNNPSNQSNFINELMISSRTGQKAAFNTIGSKLLKVGEVSATAVGAKKNSLSQAKKDESAKSYLNEV